MKKPMLAFLFSFLLPGAGFWYLRQWKYGFINLGAVLLVGIVLSFVLPADLLEQHRGAIAAGCSGGSGALAKLAAEAYNRKWQIANDTLSTTAETTPTDPT